MPPHLDCRFPHPHHFYTRCPFRCNSPTLKRLHKTCKPGTKYGIVIMHHSSICQAQQQAMHLARLHQKHSNLAAAAAANSLTQSAETTAGDAGVSTALHPPAAAAATTRPNNAPVTGNIHTYLPVLWLFSTFSSVLAKGFTGPSISKITSFILSGM